jgi:hypothetical protein
LLPAAGQCPRQHSIEQRKPKEHHNGVLPLLREGAEEGSYHSKDGMPGGLQPHGPVVAARK